MGNIFGLNGLLTFIQLFFIIVIGLYFWNLLRSQQGSKVAVEREVKKELEKIQSLGGSPWRSRCPSGRDHGASRRSSARRTG